MCEINETDGNKKNEESISPIAKWIISGIAPVVLPILLVLICEFCQKGKFENLESFYSDTLLVGFSVAFNYLFLHYEYRMKNNIRLSFDIPMLGAISAVAIFWSQYFYYKGKQELPVLYKIVMIAVVLALLALGFVGCKLSADKDNCTSQDSIEEKSEE